MEKKFPDFNFSPEFGWKPPCFPWLGKVFNIFPDFLDRWEPCWGYPTQKELGQNDRHLWKHYLPLRAVTTSNRGKGVPCGQREERRSQWGAGESLKWTSLNRFMCGHVGTNPSTDRLKTLPSRNFVGGELYLGFIYITTKFFFFHLCRCCCRCSINTQIGNNATCWQVKKRVTSCRYSRAAKLGALVVVGAAPNTPPEGAGAEAVDLLALKVNRELLGAVVVVAVAAAAGVAPNLKGSAGAAGWPEPEPVKLNVAFFALLTPSSV